MDEENVWRAVDRQRVSVADLLAQLSEDEWGRPSLCTGWTVRDVAGAPGVATAHQPARAAR